MWIPKEQRAYNTIQETIEKIPEISINSVSKSKEKSIELASKFKRDKDIAYDKMMKIFNRRVVLAFFKRIDKFRAEEIQKGDKVNCISNPLSLNGDRLGFNEKGQEKYKDIIGLVNVDMTNMPFNDREFTYPEKTIVFVKTETVELTFTAKITKFKDKQIDIYFRFSINKKLLTFLPAFLLKAGLDKVVAPLVSHYWINKYIDPTFDKNYKISDKVVISGVVKLSDGTLFYIPTESKVYDRRKEYYKLIAETQTPPKNNLILIDGEQQLINYTNSNGTVSVFVFQGAMALNNEDVKRVLDKTVLETVRYFDSLWGLLSKTNQEDKNFLIYNYNKRS